MSTAKKKKVPVIPRVRHYKGSLVDNIAELEVGESISKSTRVNPEQMATISTKEIFDQMSGYITPGLARFRKLDEAEGRVFKIERGSFATQDGALVHSVVMTRME